MQRGGVEATHLVGVQALVLCLHGQVRDRLAEVVARPRAGLALGVDGLGDVHDEYRGRVGPRLVEAQERVVHGGEGGSAATGDDEAPRLHVVRRRRPAGGLEDGAQRLDRDLGRRVVGARAPTLHERVDELRGGVGAAGGEIGDERHVMLLLSRGDGLPGRRRPVPFKRIEPVDIPNASGAVRRAAQDLRPLVHLCLGLTFDQGRAVGRGRWER